MIIRYLEPLRQSGPLVGDVKEASAERINLTEIHRLPKHA